MTLYPPHLLRVRKEKEKGRGKRRTLCVIIPLPLQLPCLEFELMLNVGDCWNLTLFFICGFAILHRTEYPLKVWIIMLQLFPQHNCHHLYSRLQVCRLEVSLGLLRTLLKVLNVFPYSYPVTLVTLIFYPWPYNYGSTVLPKSFSKAPRSLRLAVRRLPIPNLPGRTGSGPTLFLTWRSYNRKPEVSQGGTQIGVWPATTIILHSRNQQGLVYKNKNPTCYHPFTVL